MIYKYLFYFFSWLEKKCDIFESSDHYVTSYFIVGLTIAANIFLMINVFFIFFVHSPSVYDLFLKAMPILIFVPIVLSALFFKHNNRRDIIYAEVDQAPTRNKVKYGIYCFFYFILSFGMWFMSNDIIHVLKYGYGLSYAENIVRTLHLVYW